MEDQKVSDCVFLARSLTSEIQRSSTPNETIMSFPQHSKQRSSVTVVQLIHKWDKAVSGSPRPVNGGRWISGPDLFLGLGEISVISAASQLRVTSILNETKCRTALEEWARAPGRKAHIYVSGCE